MKKPARPHWLTDRPIAHRGLHDSVHGIPENTLSAAQAAIERGFAIEMDLRLSADNHMMVFHDLTLDRLTERAGPVLALERADLRRTRIAGSDEAIPSLDDLLDLVDGRVPLILEMKSTVDGYDAMVGPLLASLAAYRGPVAAMSFDPRLIAALAEAAPHLPRGIVADAARDDEWKQLTGWQRRIVRHLLHAPRSKPQFVAFDIKALPATAPLALKWFRGMPLLSWTIRTRDEEKKARYWADQIIFEEITPDAA